MYNPCHVPCNPHSKLHNLQFPMTYWIHPCQAEISKARVLWDSSYSNQHFLPPASCCKSWFIHFEQGESLLIILCIPWTQRHTAVSSAQSELFFRLLLKNTVCRVQIVAWTQRKLWKIWGPPIFQTDAEMWSELPHWSYHLWRRYIAKTWASCSYACQQRKSNTVQTWKTSC